MVELGRGLQRGAACVQACFEAWLCSVAKTRLHASCEGLMGGGDTGGLPPTGVVGFSGGVSTIRLIFIKVLSKR